MRQVVEQFSVNPGISVTQEEYRGLLSALESHAPVELVARLAAWQFEPAAQRLALIGKQTQTLAERLGKGSLRVEVEPTELRLPPKKWAPLWAVLGHVLRNAVDHGIEGPEERLLSGKPAPTLTLALRRATDDLVLTVADDGRGVDWTRIAERGRALGLAVATPEELDAALFEEGVSIRAEVTQTSGRGVGLAAVRDGVRRLGGRLELGSVPGRGTTVRIYLPTTMLADASGDSEPIALGRRHSEQRSDRSVRSG
jgi:signal transduction histidine kinase